MWDKAGEVARPQRPQNIRRSWNLTLIAMDRHAMSVFLTGCEGGTLSDSLAAETPITPHSTVECEERAEIRESLQSNY